MGESGGEDVVRARRDRARRVALGTVIRIDTLAPTLSSEWFTAVVVLQTGPRATGWNRVRLIPGIVADGACYERTKPIEDKSLSTP